MSSPTIPEFTTIDLAVTGSVARISLNRPEKRNAINQQMHRDLKTALDHVRRSSDIRALVITGEGTAFCAGQDLTEFGIARADPEFRVDDHVRTTFNRLITTLTTLELPVIAALNGVAAGAGCSIALAADIRIAGETAKLSQAFTHIGLVPDTGSSWLLPDLIGTGRAMHMALTGDAIDARTALDWGLVTEIVAADELAEHAHTLATRLAAMPTRALALTKRAVRRAAHTTLADALEYEAQLQQVAAATDDHREGVVAFLEKRSPEFVGH